MTIRRFAAAALLVIGIGLLIHTTPAARRDPTRVGAIVVLAVGGIIVSAVAASAAHIRVRYWLRGLACTVGGVFCISMLALHYRLTASILPTVPEGDLVLRQAMSDWAHNLLGLAFALAYAAATVAVLPPLARSPACSNSSKPVASVSAHEPMASDSENGGPPQMPAAG